MHISSGPSCFSRRLRKSRSFSSRVGAARARPTRTRATHGLHEDRDIVTIMLLLLLGAVAYEEDWDRGSLVQKLDASQMQTAIMKHDKVRTID